MDTAHVENTEHSRLNQLNEEGPRILLVDDEESILLALYQNLALTNKGFTVGTAASAEDALLILENSNVDILVTDLRLPEMDGLSLIKTVNERYPDTRSFLMTAYGNSSVFNEAQLNGCKGYLEKPFSFTDLLIFIEEELNTLRPSKSRPSALPSAVVVLGKNPTSGQGVFRLAKEEEKAIIDFSTDDLVLAPEPKIMQSDVTKIEDFSEEHLILQPEQVVNVEELNEEREKEKKALVRELVLTGIEQFRKHRFEEARLNWNRALKIDPGCREARSNLKILCDILKKSLPS